MNSHFTRRDALGLGLSAAAMAATGASAQTPSAVKVADAPAPKLEIEKGANLRMLRPVRFVAADEDVFRANAAKFTQKTGVEVKVDFVGWEDINQQTAVTSNSGAGPDIIIGFGDAPPIYVDKLIELTDVADYLGKRYGGWLFLAEKYGKRYNSNTWIGLPFGASGGPLVYRKSMVKAAGFDRVPDDHAGFLDLCQKLQKAGFLLSYNSDYLRRRNWIQICLMGEYSKEKIEALLTWLSRNPAVPAKHLAAQTAVSGAA